MARARRAKPRRSRALIALVALVLLVGGAMAALRLWPGALTAAGPASSPSTDGRTPPAPPTSSATTTTPTPATHPAASSTTPPARAAAQVLASCRNRVHAADRVLATAETGVGHWAAHVGAERDAQAGRISVEERQRVFKATRVRGPADQKRYADARRAYDRVRDASCGTTKGADKEVAADLAACARHSQAQAPLLAAADDAMGDWKDHLADMQRSRTSHVENAQGIWIATYQAAPPHINAYGKARRKFDPPRC